MSTNYSYTYSGVDDRMAYEGLTLRLDNATADSLDSRDRHMGITVFSPVVRSLRVWSHRP